MEITTWENEFNNRQVEIQRKQKELQMKQMKLQAWENEFQNRQVNFIMANGIVVKTLYNL